MPEHRRTELAASFTSRALEAFAAVRAPGLQLSEAIPLPAARLDHAAAEIASAVGADAGHLPLIEGLHFVTSLYPALLAEAPRAKLGAFYTPPCLVARLLDQVTEHGLDWRTARVLDPAAGAAAFLVQAALRMREAMEGAEPAFIVRQIVSRLSGLEVDPHAAALAQAALEVTLADLAQTARVQLPAMVHACDSLETATSETYDLVIGNPPYGRVTLSPPLRKRFARSLYGHANLYGVFTDLALRWTKPGGLVAFLTPTSFLAGQYYSALRGLLASEAPPVALDFVHARKGVFEDAMQETLLALYRKGGKAGRAQIHYLHVANECEARITRNGTVGLPADSRAPWLAPRAPEHSALIARAEQMQARLVDLGYSVSTGPLVWNRFKDQLRSAPDEKCVHPLIWAECVTSDGRFVFRALKRNHAPYFKVKPGDGWLIVNEPCVLVQRTTAKEQPRRLIAAELPAEFVIAHRGVIVENHLNMVRASAPRAAPAGVIAALLNSRVVDDLFRCMSGSVAVSAFELEALPLPPLCDLRRLAALVRKGAPWPEIERECARLYGRDES